MDLEEKLDTQETTLEIPRGTDKLLDAEKNMWSNMRWRTLFCLLEAKGHLPISELAQTAGLSSMEAIKALESMELLGMIRKTEKGFAQIKTHFKSFAAVPNTRPEIISNFVLSADQALNRLVEQVDSERHKTRSLVYNSSHKAVENLYEKIDKALEEFKVESDNAKNEWDGVFAFSLAIVDVTGGLK